MKTKKLSAILMTLTMVVGMVTSVKEVEATNINKGTEFEYSYTGGVQTFTAPETGRYYIGCYGASGGGASLNTGIGGTGGKTYGYYDMHEGDKIYMCIGGQGTNTSGGYNGGGAANDGGQGGGGCTSITTVNRGELKNFEYHKTEVIMVAGGGGGQV